MGVCSVCFSKTNIVTFCWRLIRNGSSVSRWRYRLRKKFRRTSETIGTVGLKIKGSKCNFVQKRVSFLGQFISKSGVKVDPEKEKAIKRMKEPSSLNYVRTFPGLVGYYREYFPGFGKTAEPLYSLLNKSNKFERSTECKNAVTEFKKKLLDALVLGHPNDRDPYTFTKYASLTGIGAILTQKQGTEDRVIGYASKTLSKSQRNYSATKRKLLAIVHFTLNLKTIYFICTF